MGSFFCAIFCPPVVFLAPWPAASCICPKAQNSLVFVGRKPHAPCSGNARSNQLSGGTRNKYRWKKEFKKRTHGTRKQGRQKSIFEAKMAPKMDPGGLLKRVRKTVGNSSAQKGLLDASGAAKQSENRILKSSAAIPAFPPEGREGVGKGSGRGQ